jgi:hypothetical protein
MRAIEMSEAAPKLTGIMALPHDSQRLPRQQGCPGLQGRPASIGVNKVREMKAEGTGASEITSVIGGPV